MSWKAPSNWISALLATAAPLIPGCTDDETNDHAAASADTDPASTGVATTGSTGDGEAPAPVVELRDDLCDAPPSEAVIDALLMSVAADGDPPYGERNLEQLDRMAAEPLKGPFYMVNLIRYRAQAEYADGRDTDLTGQEANALYSPVEFLDAIGAAVVFSGSVASANLGESDAWDDVAIVEYPCPLALFAMGADPQFQERAVHKDAGVEASIVMVTHRRILETVDGLSDPFPATADAPSFEQVQVVRLRDQASYPADANEPAQSGQDALAAYAEAVAEVGPSVGVLPRARLDVEGVFIGDGRPWDQVWIDFVPSGAAWQALHDDPNVVAAAHHFDAAVEDAYGLATLPTISRIPGAVEGGDDDGGTTLPVTPDGTGTPCIVDADCPGDGVETCLNPGGVGGFCTRQGCGSGDCESPFTCCGGCSEAVAAQLPFEGSACLPTNLVDQVTQAPASCTCG